MYNNKSYHLQGLLDDAKLGKQWVPEPFTTGNSYG